MKEMRWMIRKRDEGDEVDGQTDVKEMRWIIRQRDGGDEVDGESERWR
jgi:hypothetical protein